MDLILGTREYSFGVRSRVAMLRAAEPRWVVLISEAIYLQLRPALGQLSVLR